MICLFTSVAAICHSLITDLSYRTTGLWDFEASANINGTVGTDPFHTFATDGQIKPYRLWARYSSRQFELRAGLQKINFGSASMLRPLMWFDQVDPRDPLKLTDGVLGVLGRYYFLNNANIWLWALYGLDKPKGWEITRSNSDYPELGGRIQLPVPKGETAFTYHHRVADTRGNDGLFPEFSEIRENRLGFDIKLDVVVGLWFEASWSNYNKDLGIFTNQEVMNIGIDYTFGLGNGLSVACEQLFFSTDEKAFALKNRSLFSLLSLSYPVGLSDNIGAIVYYDWDSGNAYSFVNWQKQFNNITLYLMGYWNPVNYKIPLQGTGQNLFAGKGIQLMFVFNH